MVGKFRICGGGPTGGVGWAGGRDLGWGTLEKGLLFRGEGGGRGSKGGVGNITTHRGGGAGWAVGNPPRAEKEGCTRISSKGTMASRLGTGRGKGGGGWGGGDGFLANHGGGHAKSGAGPKSSPGGGGGGTGFPQRPGSKFPKGRGLEGGGHTPKGGNARGPNQEMVVLFRSVVTHNPL